MPIDPSMFPEPSAWFLGPKAEHAATWKELLSYVLDDYVHWRRNYFPNDPLVISRADQREPVYQAWLDDLSEGLDQVLDRLKGGFPIYSPRYLAHMLSEQTLPSMLGWFAGLLYNSNDVTGEAGPVTVPLEIEVGWTLCEMLGYDASKAWGHITSGGTVANLEALWIARSVQFLPLILREFCRTPPEELRLVRGEPIDFEVTTASGITVQLADTNDASLLHLRTGDSIVLVRRLVNQLAEQGCDPRVALKVVHDAVRRSPFNAATSGSHSVFSRIQRSPVVLVSSAAHYSIPKACNVLGYGESAARLIPVDSNFRVDASELAREVERIVTGTDSYLAAVVAVLGTTEEGAVDPLDLIAQGREDSAAKNDASYWLHVDAAWGGYIASMLREESDDAGPPGEPRAKTEQRSPRLPSRSQWIAREQIRGMKESVYNAFRALPESDSITVDPHKMGYVPYPAGAVVFRNRLVTEHVARKVHYLSADDDSSVVAAVDTPVVLDEIGPFILEGSKPGAAATACWLQHAAIPLVATGHGRLVRRTLASAHTLYEKLGSHRRDIQDLGLTFGAQPFTFEPLFSPDTNIVCYIARPMASDGKDLVPTDCGLSDLNRLNRAIFEEAGRVGGAGGDGMPYGHPYFLSHTTFESSQYPVEAMDSLLLNLRISRSDYLHSDGLFALRSAVMNPYYREEASPRGESDYLSGFIRYLHGVAGRAISA